MNKRGALYLRSEVVLTAMEKGRMVLVPMAGGGSWGWSGSDGVVSRASCGDRGRPEGDEAAH